MEENQDNISPEQRQSILEQRKQRLQSMGLPIPVTPIVPTGVTNVKDPKMLSKIQQIRNGNLRQKFKAFENKANGKPDFEEIPVSKPKGNPRQVQENGKSRIHIPLEEFTVAKDPKIDALENMFNFDGGSSKAQTASGLKEEFNVQVDDGGKSFTNDLRSKFHNRMREKEQQFSEGGYINQQNFSMPQIQSGMIILNEEDLKKKIIEITTPLATQIATDVIKKVLNEYAKKTTSTTKTVVNEKAQTAQTRKIEGEILPGGKIKINGQIFKISNDK